MAVNVLKGEIVLPSDLGSRKTLANLVPPDEASSGRSNRGSGIWAGLEPNLNMTQKNETDGERNSLPSYIV